MPSQPKSTTPKDQNLHQRSQQAQNNNRSHGIQPRQMGREMKRDLTRFHSPTTENKDSVPVQLEALSASNTFAVGDSGNNASEIKRGHHQITQKMGRSILGNKERPDLDLAESPPNKYPQHQITQKTSKITESITEKSTSNNTGLPDDLKSGIENLSGYLMD
ncbi:hypothetical protein C9994_13705, partial [Marivirga lumbricoides]